MMQVDGRKDIHLRQTDRQINRQGDYYMPTFGGIKCEKKAEAYILAFVNPSSATDLNLAAAEIF